MIRHNLLATHDVAIALFIPLLAVLGFWLAKSGNWQIARFAACMSLGLVTYFVWRISDNMKRKTRNAG